MKLRKEYNGYHFFDRETGMHLLVDEIKPNQQEYSVAPRTVSVAITNDCNTSCSFCHVQKGKQYLSKQFITEACQIFDELGAFDIAIGGGEPFLHPDIIDICKDIWKSTNLGISITTNGQLLNEDIIERLSGSISFLRISIDTINPQDYRDIRNFDISKLINNLSKLRGKIPFGINSVINSKTISGLNEILAFSKVVGAEELLLLPMIQESKFTLTQTEWSYLGKWINSNVNEFPIRILEEARKQITIPVLFDQDSYYLDYLYLSAEQSLKESSYSSDGELTNITTLRSSIMNWRIKYNQFNKPIM